MRRSHRFRLKRFKNLEAVKEIQNPILLKKREKGIFNRFFSEKKKSKKKKSQEKRPNKLPRNQYFHAKRRPADKRIDDSRSVDKPIFFSD